VKLHTVLDYDNCMPAFMHLSDGKKHDVRAAQEIEFPEDSIVVADRGYVDYKWMKQLEKSGVSFVIRGKENQKFEYFKNDLDKTKAENENIVDDWTVVPESTVSREKYGELLRMVQVFDPVNKSTFQLLTNNFTWTASTLSELYKRRWAI